MTTLQNHKARVGSIISGTLRDEDLIEAFRSELDYLTNVERSENQAALLKACDETQAREEDDDPDDCAEIGELIEDLRLALEDLAPPYCYFGALEGDGADFGFWPSWDAINDLPKISDPAEADAMREDCVFVNDHGNVTVYQAQIQMVPVLELV